MSRLLLLLWLVIMQNANAPAAAAPAPAARQLVRLPTGPDEAKLAKNRKTVKGWFEGKNRKPWLYELRRRTNFGACKACYHFKANISDQLTKGEFKLVHDGRIRGDFLTAHEKHQQHRANWTRFVEIYGADAALPGDRDPDGRPVVGAVPPAAAAVNRLNVIVTSTRLIMRSIFKVCFTNIITYGASSSFQKWLDCAESNGTELGNVENSHRSKVTYDGIVASISGLLRLDQMKRLMDADFFALLGDGSEQGRGEAEAEALAVQYWQHVPGGSRTVTCASLKLIQRGYNRG